MNFKKNNILSVLSFSLIFCQLQSMESRGETKSNEGTISLTPAIISLTSLNPNSAIYIGGILPTAEIKIGRGVLIGQIYGMGFSREDKLDPEGEKYQFTINLQIPIAFSTPYSSSPIVKVNIESNKHFIDPVNPETKGTVEASSANISEFGAIINLKFDIYTLGLNYDPHALFSVEAALNDILSKKLSINYSIEG